MSEIDWKFLAEMEIILDIYEQPYNPQRPVICFDERPGQLHSEVREPHNVAPGHGIRQDPEYKREGTYNAFMMVEPLGGWRHVSITKRRTAEDFAEQMQWLAQQAYPDAEEIIVICDQLSTHKLTNLWKRFEAAEALTIAKRIRLVHTPVHASWLNMAEIELAAFRTQCLGHRRLADLQTVRGEAQAWQEQRNEQEIKIRWGFTVDKARDKFGRHYPKELS